MFAERTSRAKAGLEEILGRRINPRHVDTVFALLDELEEHDEALDEELQTRITEDVTLVPDAVINAVYDLAVNYARTTLDESVRQNTEGRYGGLLILIGDKDQPGLFNPYQTEEDGYLRKTRPRLVTGPHPQVEERFPEGVSLEGENSLTDLLNYYAEDPHGDDKDLGIFIDLSGDVVSTKTRVTNTSARMEPEPLYRGNTKFIAARAFSHTNPDSVAIMVSSAKGMVYLMQNGIVKRATNIETGEVLDHAPISVAKQSYAA